MRLFFVRHGQSENNALWAQSLSYNGRVSDPQLTNIGKQQIEHTARFLDYCLTSDSQSIHDPSCFFESGKIHLYCSLMERSIQSGLIISERLNAKLKALVDVHEKGGIYHFDEISAEPVGESGYGRTFFENKYPDLILPEEVNCDGWWNKEYETSAQSKIRAKKVMEFLLINHGKSDDSVIFISHGGFYNELLGVLFGDHSKQDCWFELFNGAVSLFHFEDGFIKIYFSNCYDFIPAELVT